MTAMSPHRPVLLDAVLRSLCGDGTLRHRVIDGTLGAGGHTRAMLEAGVEAVMGFDVDPQARAIAAKNLAEFGDRVTIEPRSYTEMKSATKAHGWQNVDGVLLDLGISSMQIDTADRGFAFMKDGPLDMRFDPQSSSHTAADIVNHWDENALADIFFKYGEERHSRRIAKTIVGGRPFETTTGLAESIEKAVPKTRKTNQHRKSAHPATRVFQALRIAVNDELNRVAQVLPTAIDLLKPGGRLAVISFHSLEDRIVKQYFKEASTEVKSPPGMVLEEKVAIVKLVTRKPIVADAAEIAENPRSRSAKLRVIEKL